MHEQWKIEYDQRQYRLMIENLEAFRCKKIGINTLILTLKGLLNTLELKNHDWIENAISEWGNLEISYALECERYEEAGLDIRKIDSNFLEMESVKKSILKLEHLVQERLNILTGKV